MIIFMALIGFSVACLALGLTARQADARKPLFLLGMLGLGVAALLTALS